MPKSDFELTRPQTAALVRTLEDWRGGRTYTAIARVMQDTDNVKNLAGYVGDAFQGRPRGIRYIFGNPKRMAELARALEVSLDDLAGLLRQVKKEAPSYDDVRASGLEDLGDLPLDDIFVCPPLRCGAGLIDEDELRRLCTRTYGGVVTLSGPFGAGASTLLRRIARWARSEGYTPHWHDGSSELPNGRGTILLGDRTTGSSLPALSEWMKSGDRRVVVALDPASPLRGPYDAVRIEPVDEAWLQQWSTRARALGARWLPRKADPLQQMVASWALGPEEATTAWRWLADTRAKELDGAAAVHRALERRRRGDEVVPAEAVLRAMAKGDVIRELQVGHAQEVEEDLARADLSPTTRRLLEHALPSIDVSGQVEQLERLGLVRRTAAGPELRFATLLTHETDDPLQVLTHAPAPQALRRWLSMPYARREALSWTAEAFARCLALALVSGERTLPSSPLGMPTVRTTDIDQHPLGTCHDDLSVERLRATMDAVADELGIERPNPSDDALAYVLAAANLGHSDWADDRIWRAAGRRERLPRHWVEAVAASEHLEAVLDPTSHVGAGWLLSHSGAIDEFATWLRALADRSTPAFRRCVEQQLQWAVEHGDPASLRPLHQAFLNGGRTTQQVLRDPSLLPGMEALQRAVGADHYVLRQIHDLVARVSNGTLPVLSGPLLRLLKDHADSLHAPSDPDHPVWVACDTLAPSYAPPPLPPPAETAGALLDLHQRAKQWERREEPRRSSSPKDLGQFLPAFLGNHARADRWVRLVRQAFAECTKPSALLDLLGPDALPEATDAVVATLRHVVELCRRSSSAATDAWLAQRLADRPDLFDHAGMIPVWSQYSGATEPLHAYLRVDDGSDRGAGVLAAFDDELETWRARPSTQRFASERMLVVSAASWDGSWPISDETLQALANNKLLDGLIEASITWGDESQRRLWRRAAVYYTGITRAWLLAAEPKQGV